MPESSKDAPALPFEAMPPEARLDMPVQNLQAPANMEGRGRTPATSPSSIVLRRLSVIGSALALTAYGAWRTHMVMDEAGVSALGIIMLVLFIALFMWIALAFTSSVAGFCSLVAHGGLGLGIRRTGPLPELTRRTALLLPTYNEPPHRVMAGLRAIYSSLEETGRLDSFDLFILSDTTNPDVWVKEEAAFLALREQVGGQGRIFIAAGTTMWSARQVMWVSGYAALAVPMTTWLRWMRIPSCPVKRWCAWPMPWSATPVWG